jgi:hypothetical protein
MLEESFPASHNPRSLAELKNALPDADVHDLRGLISLTDEIARAIFVPGRMPTREEKAELVDAVKSLELQEGKRAIIALVEVFVPARRRPLTAELAAKLDSVTLEYFSTNLSRLWIAINHSPNARR